MGQWIPTLRKKREPKWLSWRVVLKISSLLWGRAAFFFIIMFRKKKAAPLKREPFSKTALWAVIALQGSCYGSPGETFHLIKKGFNAFFYKNHEKGHHFSKRFPKGTSQCIHSNMSSELADCICRAIYFQNIFLGSFHYIPLAWGV